MGKPCVEARPARRLAWREQPSAERLVPVPLGLNFWVLPLWAGWAGLAVLLTRSRVCLTLSYDGENRLWSVAGQTGISGLAEVKWYSSVRGIEAWGLCM